MEELKIRKANNEDANDIVRFHNSNYQDSRLPTDWLWEHTSDPNKQNIFIVATNGAKIIGTQGMIPIELCTPDGIMLSGKSENTLVNSAYRGGVLFPKMYKFAIDLCEKSQMKFIWGFTTAIKALKNIGFIVSPDILSKYYCVLNISQCLKDIWVSNKSLSNKGYRLLGILTLGGMSKKRLLQLSSIGDDNLIQSEYKSPGDIINTNNRIASRYKDTIFINMTENYVNWRIIKNPFIKYRCYYLYDRNILRAYSFVNVKNKSCAYLTDIMFEKNTYGTVLLSSIIRDIRKDGFGMVTYWGSRINELSMGITSLLKTYGFVESREPMRFIVMNLRHKNCENYVRFKNWYINGLWTEGTTV